MHSREHNAATIQAIVRATDARRCGTGWRGRTICHDGDGFNLAIAEGSDGQPLLKCFSHGCSYREIASALRLIGIDLASGTPALRGLRPLAQSIAPEIKPNWTRIAAAAIWNATVPAPGSLVEVYLESRGLLIAPPPDLRFHPALKHPLGSRWPAMVALVRDGKSGEPHAIHRTFLGRDGHGKAPIKPAKMALGPCRGGAVQLGPASDRLLVGEGIETTLAAMQATGIPGWAALGTSGLRSLRLPDVVQEVVVLADADVAGEMAARDGAMRWHDEGRLVRIARPPRGSDFNDTLIEAGDV